MLMDPSQIHDKRCCYDSHLFVEPPPHDILCCVDGRVAKDAVRSRACSHFYGMQCILEYLVNHEQCPKCGVALDCTMLEPSEAIRQHILRAPVRCPTGTARCDWQGPMAELFVHLHSETCGVPKNVCPFCHQSFDSQEFEQVHKQECPEALVLCNICEDIVPRKFIEEHKELCIDEAKRKKAELDQANAAAVAAKKKTAGMRRGAAAAATPIANRRTSTTARVSSSAVANDSAKKRRSSLTEQHQAESITSSATARPSDAAKKRASSAMNRSGTNLVVASPGFQQQQQQVSNNVVRPNSATSPIPHHHHHHDLSIRSPNASGFGASRRLLDESQFQQQHQARNHGFGQYPPAALSPGALQQWRTMTSFSSQQNPTTGTSSMMNSSQLMAMMLQNQQHHLVSQNNINNNGSPDFGSLTTLVQEVSRVGQKCTVLEQEVQFLKKANCEKDAQMNVLMLTMKKMEGQLESLMKSKFSSSSKTRRDNNNNNNNKHEVESKNNEGEEEEAEEDQFSLAFLKKQASKRPTSPPERASRDNKSGSTLPPIHNNNNASQQQQQQQQQQRQQPQYATRNKAYKPAASSQQQATSASPRSASKHQQQQQYRPSQDEIFKLPKDVVKDVKRTSTSNDVDEIMKRNIGATAMSSSTSNRKK